MLPHLSIIIPTLNESKAIVELLENLFKQEKAPLFEIIVVDGGSNDGTNARINSALEAYGSNVYLVHSSAGRGRQMNEGVKQAQGKAFLFLHADTVITDPLLLHHAHQDMQAAYEQYGHERVAGHFGLHFIREQSGCERAYYFYECKTRLNRDGCINGDQGLWIGRDFFTELGGFDESLPFMEDARIASAIFQYGEWLTLSGGMFTSARRFESEGLKERQTLNALMCAMDDIGMEAFFLRATEVYRSQKDVTQLKLWPFLKVIHQSTWERGWKQGVIWWWGTGKYVISNAWQLVFALDCRNQYANNIPVSDVQAPRLRHYDRYFRVIVESFIGQFLAMVVTFLWFYGRLLFRRSK